MIRDKLISPSLDCLLDTGLSSRQRLLPELSTMPSRQFFVLAKLWLSLHAHWHVGTQGMWTASSSNVTEALGPSGAKMRLGGHDEHVSTRS